MKTTIKIILTLIMYPAISMSQASNIDTAKMPGLMVSPDGEIAIKPSATSASTDFDFFEGKWELAAHRLKERLVNCKEWTDFTVNIDMYRILNGKGNIDHGLLPSFDGKPAFEGMTLRLFDPKTRLWSIYWITSTTSKLGVPNVGSFDGNVGYFYSKDIYNGKAVITVIKWDKTDPDNVKWSQAFSADNGKTWEWNWYMLEKRVSNTNNKRNG
jgi:hypothetical protein